MATVWQPTQIDDVTGLAGEDVRQFIFEIDGVIYEIDACLATREAIRSDMEKYTRVARAREHTVRNYDSMVVRDWARSQGYSVTDRGRVPAKILDAYLQAHP